MNETEKQFSSARAASSTSGRAKSNFLSVLLLFAAIGAPAPPAEGGFLSIERLGSGSVRVSWSLPETGYVLYHTTNLLSGWTLMPPPYVTNATHLSKDRSEPAEFFKLVRP